MWGNSRVLMEVYFITGANNNFREKYGTSGTVAII